MDNIKKTTVKKSRKKSSAVKRVHLRNIFLYSTYRKVNTILFLLILLNMIAAASLLYFAFKDVPPRYIPLNEKNQVIEEQSLSNPSGFEDSDIFAFSMDSIRAINVYDYINYKEQLQSGMEYFTNSGWDNYVQGFSGSATLNTVKRKHFVVTVQPTGSPEISRQGVINSVYKWQVKQPVEIKYFSAGSSKLYQEGVVTMLITRRAVTESSYGMGIEVYVFDVKK